MLSTALKLKNVYENHSNSRNCKKYSLTPTICWKFTKAFGTHPDSFISSDVCCYPQPRFDLAGRLFHKLGKGYSPDHGSFTVAGYGCQWPGVRILRKGMRWFSWPMISTLISSMESPVSQLACSDTVDLRSQACTDFRCSYKSFSPCAQFPCCFTVVLCITILVPDIVNDPKFLLSHDFIFYFGLTSRWRRVLWGLKQTWTSRFLKILWRISETPLREHNKLLSTGVRPVLDLFLE